MSAALIDWTGDGDSRFGLSMREPVTTTSSIGCDSWSSCASTGLSSATDVALAKSARRTACCRSELHAMATPPWDFCEWCWGEVTPAIRRARQKRDAARQVEAPQKISPEQ